MAYRTYLSIQFNDSGGSGGQQGTRLAAYAYVLDDLSVQTFSFCNWVDHTVYVTSVPAPTKGGSVFGGYYLGTYAVSASDGKLLTYQHYPTGVFTDDATAYAAWRNCSVVTFGSAKFYRAVSDGRCYSDAGLTTEISSVSVPTKTGYTFANATIGGVVAIAADGTITDAYKATSVTTDQTLSVNWTANQYNLVFDYKGGSLGPASKTVTFDEQIGALPSSSRASMPLLDWSIDGSVISSTTVWRFPTDKTAKAAFTSFGRVTDYFGLASSTLVPIQSNEGAGASFVVAYNGSSETPTTDARGTLRNPSVTYEVVGDMTLNVTLGAAFAGEVYEDEYQSRVENYSKKNLPKVSGFMITAVRVSFELGRPPQVTVSSVANEGFECVYSGPNNMYFRRAAKATPAVKTYSLQMPLSARHRPQDPMSCMAFVGDLQSLEMSATADPFVLFELGMPCASDICHGRIEVNASVADYGETVSVSPTNGFSIVSQDAEKRGTGYKVVKITARKELG